MFYVITAHRAIPTFFGPFGSFEEAERCAMEQCWEPCARADIVKTQAIVEADHNKMKALRKL